MWAVQLIRKKQLSAENIPSPTATSTLANLLSWQPVPEGMVANNKGASGKSNFVFVEVNSKHLLASWYKWKPCRNLLVLWAAPLAPVTSYALSPFSPHGVLLQGARWCVHGAAWIAGEGRQGRFSCFLVQAGQIQKLVVKRGMVAHRLQQHQHHASDYIMCLAGEVIAMHLCRVSSIS